MANLLTDRDFWVKYWESKTDLSVAIPENYLFHQQLSDVVKKDSVKTAIELGGFPGYYAVFLKKYLKLDVTFHFPNKQRRDIDNFLKATIDSLVKCGLCVDDEQFDELSVKRGEIIKGGLIKIIVLELQK